MFSPYYNLSEDHPVDEYFLLYDFDILDNSSVGDTVIFGDTLNNVKLLITEIDTVQINGVEKRRYRILTGEYGERVDYLIEGIGGLHPFTPLLEQALYATCSCNFEITYTSAIDTLVLSDTIIFGADSNFNFCSTVDLPKYENSSKIDIFLIAYLILGHKV